MPQHRLVSSLATARAFVPRTIASERGHTVFFLAGLLTVGYATSTGRVGFAIYLTAGNVILNLYPIFLQRYTRARLLALTERQRHLTSA